MDVVKKYLSIAQLVLCVTGLCGMVTAQGSIAPGQKFAVKSFGGYPISQNLSSFWLAGSDNRPLVMVYFYGPKDWYQTLWNIDAKFEDGKPGWAELQSAGLTLRVEVYPETGEVAIDASKFSARQSNTFLVLHTGEPLVPQEVIPLGVFDLPPSTDKPASVLLLRAHQELIEHIEEETRSDIRMSQSGKSRDPILKPPCTPQNIDFVLRNPGSSLPAAFLFRSMRGREKIFTTTYALPCSRGSIFVDDNDSPVESAKPSTD